MVEYEMPVKFAIINNGHLGMVRQWQHFFYEDNFQSVRLFQPDFVKLAEAYGAAGLRVSDKTDVEAAIQKALAHPGPVVVDFQVEEAEDTYPMMPSGASLAETIDQPKVDAPEREEVRSR